MSKYRYPDEEARRLSRAAEMDREKVCGTMAEAFLGPPDEKPKEKKKVRPNRRQKAKG